MQPLFLQGICSAQPSPVQEPAQGSGSRGPPSAPAGIDSISLQSSSFSSPQHFYLCCQCPQLRPSLPLSPHHCSVSSAFSRLSSLSDPENPSLFVFSALGLFISLLSAAAAAPAGPGPPFHLSQWCPPTLGVWEGVWTLISLGQGPQPPEGPFPQGHIP